MHDSDANVFKNASLPRRKLNDEECDGYKMNAWFYPLSIMYGTERKAVI